MDRLLIVPAAGRGTRLGADVPKALVPVAGRPMLDRLLTLHEGTVDGVVVVVAPDAVDAFATFAATRRTAIELAVQPSPTGMLDAILAADLNVRTHRPARIVVTWCDQIALDPATIAGVAARARSEDAPALLFPTIQIDRPYIHFERDEDGRISRVLQRREGDRMPPSGESDMGLFDLSLSTYLVALRDYAGGQQTGEGTGERNFLPFIPWFARLERVETFPGADPIETVGVNTPEELNRIERHLEARRHS